MEEKEMKPIRYEVKAVANVFERKRFSKNKRIKFKTSTLRTQFDCNVPKHILWEQKEILTKLVVENLQSKFQLKGEIRLISLTVI